MAVQTYETRALNMLSARLIEEQDRRGKSVINGAPETFDDYKEQVGFLRGLQFAIQRCDDVETDLRKGK